MKITLNKIKHCYALAMTGLLCLTTFIGLAQDSGSDKANISKLKVAIEASPNDLSKHEAFTKLMRGNDEAELDRQYAIWMKKYPKLATIPFAIGSVYEGRESPKAKPYLLKAVELDPKLAEGWAALAGDAERWGLFSEARNYMEKAVAADPANIGYLFSYAFSFTNVDEAKYVSLSHEVIKRAPREQRAAQALYWLAIREPKMDQKIKYWEWLHRDYPVDQFDWAAYGMGDYFNVLLSIDPAKAETLAVEMSGNKEDGGKWLEQKVLADKVIAIRKKLAQKNGQEARILLNQIKLPKYSSFANELVLMKANADDLSGKTSAAYDSLIVTYVKNLNTKLKESLDIYGKKLGKVATDINADIWKHIDVAAKVATPFTLKNYFTNANTSLEDYKGKVVLLTYWFPGCGPCRGEFPHFENVVRKFKGQDLEYVGINIVSKQNDYVLPFLKGSGYSFTPLEDVKGRAKGNLDNRGLAPINFLIDREGRVIFSFFRTSENNQDELELMIRTLLNGEVN